MGFTWVMSFSCIYFLCNMYCLTFVRLVTLFHTVATAFKHVLWTPYFRGVRSEIIRGEKTTCFLFLPLWYTLRHHFLCKSNSYLITFYSNGEKACCGLTRREYSIAMILRWFLFPSWMFLLTLFTLPQSLCLSALGDNECNGTGACCDSAYCPGGCPWCIA